MGKIRNSAGYTVAFSIFPPHTTPFRKKKNNTYFYLVLVGLFPLVLFFPGVLLGEGGRNYASLIKFLR